MGVVVVVPLPVVAPLPEVVPLPVLTLAVPLAATVPAEMVTVLLAKTTVMVPKLKVRV